MGQRVVVIGAGVGGLATAALLARDGDEVTVIEKNEQAGGRASMLERDGFRFDMGPSWYLMPDVFERFFQQMGTTTADHLKLRRLSPHYRLFFADGTHVDITGDLARDKLLFEQLEPGSAARFEQYLAEAKQKYDVSLRSILYRNLSWRDFSDPELQAQGRNLHVFESMEHYVRRFFRAEKMHQILQHTLLFLGGTPQTTPALYSLMTHVDFGLGVWYPDGGIYEVINALVRIGQQHGVRYLYNAPVTQIEVTSGRVTAVHSGAQRLPADVVVSNADYHHTETLLSDQRQRQFGDFYWRRRSLAPSAFILYLGVKGTLPTLAHHNLLFSKEWDTHFRQLVKHPVWPMQPSLYLCVPSKTDPTVAPPDHENVFILVPVASGLYETDQSRAEYADHILHYIETQLNIGIRHRIVTQQIFSVSDFASRYNSYQGSALGLAHTVWQSSIFRPPNRSKRVPNLYFVGANTTPGIGVPMCLISAQVVRDRLRAT
ncbi:MAG: phytoene desaturase [Anaerolineae bacterium]|nr:phytoene desaturase [Anaerolineae bacterium]